MARYVVLFFEDNDIAQEFATEWTAYWSVDPEKRSDGEVKALVPAPTLFCEDPFSQHGNKKAGYFRGKKYGWWVCAVCGKPTKAWGEKYNAVISSGKNLLDDEEQVTPPAGWNQLAEGTS